MVTFPDAGDPDRFHAARVAILTEFAEQASEDDLHVADQVLDMKIDLLGTDPGSWSLAEVEQVLFDLYPARAVLEPEALPLVPAGFAALLTHLGHDDLAAVASRATAAFVKAMADEDNWSAGKRVASAAAADGIDFADEGAMETWLAEFNQRSVAERDRILGPTLATLNGPDGLAMAPMPPTVLPSGDEIAAAAQQAPTVTRLIGLVGYVGAGRTLTAKGNLKLADASVLVDLLATGDQIDQVIGDRTFHTTSSAKLNGLDWVYRLALEIGLLARRGTKVVPGENAALADDTTELAYVAFLAVLHVLGPTQHRAGDDPYGLAWYAEALDEELSPMLVELYRDPDPRSIDELAAVAWAIIQDDYDLDAATDRQLDFARDGVAMHLRLALDRLAELGLVRLAGEEAVDIGHGLTVRSGGTVALTGLGVWALQRFVGTFTDAPVVGALRAHSATEMLRAAADLSRDTAQAEIECWVEHNGDRAAAALCAALADADETGRGLAFDALVRLGTDAAEAIGALRDHPELGDYATVFRVDVLGADADEADRAGDPAGWVHLVATAAELWGPQAAAAAWAEPAAGADGLDRMLQAAWRVRDSRTEAALAAVGGHHPDSRIAKAGRKALFKYRSAV